MHENDEMRGVIFDCALQLPPLGRLYGEPLCFEESEHLFFQSPFTGNGDDDLVFFSLDELVHERPLKISMISSHSILWTRRFTRRWKRRSALSSRIAFRSELTLARAVSTPSSPTFCATLLTPCSASRFT